MTKKLFLRDLKSSNVLGRKNTVLMCSKKTDDEYEGVKQKNKKKYTSGKIVFF